MSNARDYIDQEIAQLRFIYETLYPDTPSELHMWWEKSKLTTPAVTRNTTHYGPDLMGQGYLGNFRVGPAPQPSQMGQRIFVTIPSPHQIASRAAATGGTPWQDRPAHYRLVHGLSPLLAEQAKYRVEAHRWRRLAKRHRFVRLPRARDLLMNEARPLTPAGPAQGKKDPAILIALHWLDVGGAESLGLDTIRWALALGLRVFVMVGQTGPERLLGKLPRDPRVTLLRTDRYLPKSLTGLFVSQLIAQENIIATHNHHCVALYDALPTIKLHHPQVVNIDSTHIVEYADGGYPRISGVWSNFLDYHHVISRQLQAFYQQRFRVYGTKLVMGRLLDEALTDRPIPPLRINAGQSTCRVAFVGRMVHQKRPVVAVAIMRRLQAWGRRNGVTFRFDMVGEGAYRGAVEHLLTRYRLGDVVHLHPAGTDVPGLLAQSDILLVPSSNEGLALVCYEAIEAGCVPICSNVGAQAEICPPETLVRWSPRGAVRDTVALVQRLLREPGFADQVAAAQTARLTTLRAEPTAQTVITRIYQTALAAAQETVPATGQGQDPGAAA